MRIAREKVHHAARNGIPLVVRTHTLSAETENDLDEILAVYLEELGRRPLKEHLAYLLREMTGNARKANLKRVYFRTKGLDITDPEEYARGMVGFHDDVTQGADAYLWLLEKEQLHLKVTFLIRDQVLFLSVRNNCTLVPAESERVGALVARAWEFSSPEEALGPATDESEGAGLGLGIAVLLLRKMGLSPGAFTVEAQGAETVATLRVPMERVRLDKVRDLSDELTAAVEDLPPFPDNLRRLLAMLEDPDVVFSDLAAELGKDPAMTADLIKYINSAAHRGPHRIEDLDDAVRQVGIQGLKDLLYPYGAHKILGRLLANQSALWENAATVSKYASVIGRDQRFDLHDKGLVQIAGLLYNLGQIVVSFLHPGFSTRILEFCRRKGMGIAAFDDLTQAINPADLGARIATKWNFPGDLVSVLAHQSDPTAAPVPDQVVTAAVHLAACLRSVELGLLHYSQIATETLDLLGLEPPEVVGLHDRMRKEG